MKLVGLPKLDDFKKKHADVRGPLDTWRVEVENAQWGGPQAIKDRFPSASFLPDNRVIFNIKGNNYRLVVMVQYQNEIVAIQWIGTHAEYDKKDFSGKKMRGLCKEMKYVAPDSGHQNAQRLRGRNGAADGSDGAGYSDGLGCRS